VRIILKYHKLKFMSSTNYLQLVMHVASNKTQNLYVPWPVFVKVMHTVNKMTGRRTVITGELLA